MERLISQIRGLAQALEQEVRDLDRVATGPLPRAPPGDPVDRVLDRIEGRIAAVHAHTSSLVERVPEDMGRTLARLARHVPEHGASVSLGAAHPMGGGAGTTGALPAEPTESVRRLTRRERMALGLCLREGPLTYRELGERLGISPTSAKNLVNRVFEQADKRGLFRKERSGGAVRVGVSGHARRRLSSARAAPEAPAVATAEPGFG